jgi:hypothetical protein
MKEAIHPVENFCPQKAAGSAPQILLPEPDYRQNDSGKMDLLAPW